MVQTHNEQYRFGSASWSDFYEMQNANLFDRKGPQIGYFENQPIHLDSDAPMITVGGAGSGKLRDLLGYVVCNSPKQRMMILDPRGELGAISFHRHAANGEHAYFWNPMSFGTLPQHACNPLDILDPAKPTFESDCKFIAEALIPGTGGKEGVYFTRRAQEWVDALLKIHIEMLGSVTLIDLVEAIGAIESKPDIWKIILENMSVSVFESVKRAAGEIATKQAESPREFGSILGEIYAHLNFLDDPALLISLTGKDFSLAALADPSQPAKVFLNIPPTYMNMWSPLIRLFFTVGMLYKERRPDTPRLMLLVDEAGQLGKFEGLLRSFTYGRGAGIRAWAIFQDTGQIVRNFDQAALQTFLGSAQMRQFFGVRDAQTAELISKMLGSETLEYDDPHRQEAARHQKVQAMKKLMTGDDPISAGLDYVHNRNVEGLRTKQARQLMTPDEILAMPEDKQILFISGKDLKPIYASKFPYFKRKEMAGLYLPNPFHPPIDRVAVMTWRGSRWARVIRERVPQKFASFPQYQDGSHVYVEGYKPN